MSKDKESNWFTQHKPLAMILALVVVIIIVIVGVKLSTGKSHTAKNASNTSSTSQPAPKPAQPAGPWDLNAAYNKVKKGMTKKQVETALGRQATKCDTSTEEGIGTTESCHYGPSSDDTGIGTLLVIYTNGKVGATSEL